MKNAIDLSLWFRSSSHEMSSKMVLRALLVALVGLVGVVSCVDDGTDLESSTEQQVVSPPMNLVATNVSSTRTNLSWSPVAGATNYIIWKSSGPGASGTETQYTGNFPVPTATTFPDTNEVLNTKYCFQVKVFVPGQGTSAVSNEACVTTPGVPSAPTGLTAVNDSLYPESRIDLSWTALTNATQYAIYSATGAGPFSQIGSVTVPTVTFVATGLSPGTTYTYKITGRVGGVDTGFSTTATATTLAQDIEGYYRFDEKTGTTTTDASTFGRTGTLQGGAAFITTDQAPLKDSTDHNPSSLSLPTSSSNVAATTPVNFTGDSSLSMWVKLTATPTGAITFAGKRGAACGATTWLIGQNSTDLLHFDGGSVRSFGTSLAVGTWTQVGVTKHGNVIQMYLNGALVGSGTVSAGAANSTPMQIGDVGSCGNNGAFLIDEFKIYSRQLSGTEMAALGTAPPAPTNLVTTTVHSTYVRLSWDAVTGADHYWVFKGSAAGNETFLTSNQTTTFQGDHLTPNQATSWKVFTIRGGLISPASNELLVTTSDVPAAPTASAVLSTCCTPKRADISWTAVTGAVKYVVRMSTSGGPFVQVASVLAPTLTFTSGTLAAATTYDFEVLSVDDGNQLSAPSNAATVTTP